MSAVGSFQLSHADVHSHIRHSPSRAPGPRQEPGRPDAALEEPGGWRTRDPEASFHSAPVTGRPVCARGSLRRRPESRVTAPCPTTGSEQVRNRRALCPWGKIINKPRDRPYPSMNKNPLIKNSVATSIQEMLPHLPPSLRATLLLTRAIGSLESRAGKTPVSHDASQTCVPT